MIFIKKMLGALPWYDMKAYNLFFFLGLYGIFKLTIFPYVWYRWPFTILREIAECLGFFFLVILISNFWNWKSFLFILIIFLFFSIIQKIRF